VKRENQKFFKIKYINESKHSKKHESDHYRKNQGNSHMFLQTSRSEVIIKHAAKALQMLRIQENILCFGLVRDISTAIMIPMAK
jgi:hypothetical protein